MKIKLQKQLIYQVLFCGFVFVAFFSKLSINGGALSTKSTIYLWIITLFFVVALMAFCSLDKKNLIIAICIFLYLFIATIFILQSKEFRFNIARFAPIFICLVVFSINMPKMKNENFMRIIFDIVVLTIIITNILMMLGNNIIIEFICDNYTQYLEYITEYHISIKKPLGFFGVPNLAAFFYTSLFLISYCLLEKTKKLKYNFYLVILFFFCVLLRSSTSLGYALLMLLMYIFKNRKSRKIVAISLLVGIIIIVFLNSQIFVAFYENLKAGVNGFLPRYINGINGLYKDNFKVLSQFVLGIGFSTPIENTYNIYFADSGYIIFYTMGNLVLPIVLYFLFYLWLKKNIKSKEYRTYFFILAMTMELGFITFMAIKTIILYIFVMFYLKTFTE